MKVFVWKSYGEIDIHDISTQEQKEKLRSELMQALELEGETGVDEDMSLGNVIKLVNVNSGNSDVFEYGTGIYEVKG